MQLISGLKAYTSTTNFIIRGSLLNDLVILSTNEIARYSNYFYRVQFLYSQEDGTMHKVKADVPFSTMRQSQWYDKVLIREIEI